MSTEMAIREVTKAEWGLAYTCSEDIQEQTGCIGHLRADMDSNGEGFFSSWDDHRKELKTDDFKSDLDRVISSLRCDNNDAFLKNRRALFKYCAEHPAAQMDEDRNEFGFRVDTDKFAYIMRLNPIKGEYNIYCYCFVRKMLDEFLETEVKSKSMRISIEEKKKEAVKRMRMLRLFGETIRQFKEENLLSISEPPLGCFYWVKDKELEAIRDWENVSGSLVYVVIRSFTSMGQMDTCLYVSDYMEEWEQERGLLQHNSSYAYVINRDIPEFSETGYVEFSHTPASGLERTF